MTAADMILYLKSTVDESGGIVTPFYVDPADYYDALCEGQRQVVVDAVGGADKDWRAVRNLVVEENLNDGQTTANPCLIPLSAIDEAAQMHVAVRDREDVTAYQSVTLPAWQQCVVYADTVHTFPAGGNVTLRYLRPPLSIGAAQDSELDVIYHARIIEAARMVMIRKDISAPLADEIETDRNKLETFRKAVKPAQEAFAPRDVPYSNR